MNQTIYIRKINWLRFSLEETKSELINELLSKHYKQEKTNIEFDRQAYLAEQSKIRSVADKLADKKSAKISPIPKVEEFKSNFKK